MTLKVTLIKYDEADIDRIATGLGYDTYAEGFLPDPPYLTKAQYIRNRFPAGVRAAVNNYEASQGLDQVEGYQHVQIAAEDGADQ